MVSPSFFHLAYVCVFMQTRPFVVECVAAPCVYAKKGKKKKNGRKNEKKILPQDHSASALAQPRDTTPIETTNPLESLCLSLPCVVRRCKTRGGGSLALHSGLVTHHPSSTASGQLGLLIELARHSASFCRPCFTPRTRSSRKKVSSSLSSWRNREYYVWKGR